MRTCFTRRLEDPLGLAILDITILEGVSDIWPEWGYVNRINVPHAHRGKGIASELLKECLEEADGEGIMLRLDVQPSDGLNKTQLHAWYERAGFVSHELNKYHMKRVPDAARLREAVGRSEHIRDERGPPYRID